jgi:hypothetical protein
MKEDRVRRLAFGGCVVVVVVLVLSCDCEYSGRMYGVLVVVVVSVILIEDFLLRLLGMIFQGLTQIQGLGS